MKRLLLIVSFVLLCSSLYCVARQEAPAVRGAREIAPRPPLGADEASTIDLFQKSSKSVVFITTVVMQQDYFGFNVAEMPQGAGSGFIWDADGHIVTNFHVIGQADSAKVTLADHSSWDAELVGVAPEKDIAVLRIKAPRAKLVPLPIGTSKDLLVGQKVLAIGNPFGLDQSLTTGIISAIGRQIQSLTGRPIFGVIQTDAAINPGNSGGPLLDSAGRLIGMNTAIYSPSGAYAGIGFAVPVDTINSVVPQLLRTGRVARPGLGISIVDDRIARQLGVEGVVIAGVSPRSSATRAGLRALKRTEDGEFVLGDVIVELNKKPVKDTDDLFEALEGLAVGEKVTLTVLRNKKKVTLPATLEAL